MVRNIIIATTLLSSACATAPRGSMYEPGPDAAALRDDGAPSERRDHVDVNGPGAATIIGILAGVVVLGLAAAGSTTSSYGF